MFPLLPEVFQLPIPPILFLIPPSHPVQWMIRSLFLLYTTTIAIPLILVLVPISIFLSKLNARWGVVSIHPDNLAWGYLKCVRRGYTVYIVSTIIWAITGVGNAPESSISLSRRLTNTTLWIVSLFHNKRHGRPGEMLFGEEVVGQVREEYRLGAITRGKADSIVLFNLEHVASLPSSYTPSDTTKVERKAILFLAGGGYVTGTPLAHPFIFSLIRLLSMARSESETRYTLYAPCIRKSLDRSRSFPIPLIDALGAYQALIDKGYKGDEILVIGDSAGGGLCWTLLAYLAVLQSTKESGKKLDLPGRVVLISASLPLAPLSSEESNTNAQPWLSLPPTLTPKYPDFVDTPQLLNAARCYLARYPILKNRPNPFKGDLGIWKQVFKQSMDLWIDRVRALLPRSIKRRKDRLAKSSKSVLNVDEPPIGKMVMSNWIQEDMFERLTSHHPLISPSTLPTHPFNRQVFEQLKNHTKLLFHVGTAEWFYEPTIALAKQATKCGIDVCVEKEIGGFHVEGCTFPAEFGGAGERLVSRIFDWMRNE